MWSTHEAQDLAREFVMGMGRRWSHVAAVGQAAEDLASAGRISKTVAVAAWLHDVGYAPELVATGMHALDGARALERLGAAREVVALVGHHTGALYEAEERGLLAEWSELPTPDPDDLDVLTMLDLATGPSGQPTLAETHRRDLAAIRP
jgi:HD superfamily phosphodiesterase